MIRTRFTDGWVVLALTPHSEPQVATPVTLPHDAMLYQQRDANCANGHHTGYYPGGRYLYSKTFMAPEEWHHQSVALEFEGVYHRSEVRVNGQLAGGRANGYSLFTVDLDPFLIPGANEIQVLSDDTSGPTSRWYTGSGIYRPVNLLVGGQTHIVPNGLRVLTTSLRGHSATVQVSVALANRSRDGHVVTVSATLRAPDGSLIGPAKTTIAVDSGDSLTVAQAIDIPSAELWSPDSPAMYDVEVTLLDQDGALDHAVDRFGIRKLEVSALQGLKINGIGVKLRGACIHHDNGVIGAHEFDAAADRRVRLLKESGFNAIRSAHNPASPALLRACDRHGMLVMDELADVWFSKKGDADYSLDFEQWWERDLEALIAKDYNHPSVIMYSIGNEITDTWEERGIRQNRTMARKVRELDPSRFVANCLNGFLNLISPDADARASAELRAEESGKEFGKNAIQVMNRLMVVLDKVMPYIVRLPRVDRRTRDAFADVDVAGYNYMQGRYQIDSRKYPQRVIVGSETNPQSLVERWPTVEALPNVIGEFVWTGWDYIGEAGLSTTLYDEAPRIFLPYPALLAGTPIIDITGHRQTQAVYDEYAWGQRTAPQIAVQPLNHARQKIQSSGWRTTDSIRSWSWRGYDGTPAQVEVYSASPRVELLQNGLSLGSKPSGPRHGYRATFTVAYAPGELTAIALDSAGTEIGRDVLTSANSMLMLRLLPETSQLKADGLDLLFLPIELTDELGNLQPWADRRVTVTVEGAGHLLGLGSANPFSEEPFTHPSHTTYYGRALAVVRSGFDEGQVRILVEAVGCKPTTTTVTVSAAAASAKNG